MPKELYAGYMAEPITVVLADTENKTVEQIDLTMAHKAYVSKNGNQEDGILKNAAKKTEANEEKCAKSKSKKEKTPSKTKDEKKSTKSISKKR